MYKEIGINPTTNRKKKKNKNPNSLHFQPKWSNKRLDLPSMVGE